MAYLCSSAPDNAADFQKTDSPLPTCFSVVSEIVPPEPSDTPSTNTSDFSGPIFMRYPD
ncbi:TPA: hypothetical protein U2I61_003746 [Providencia rettgeri]|nr:hypothetical protein [Providencia rettgeri]